MNWIAENADTFAVGVTFVFACVVFVGWLAYYVEDMQRIREERRRARRRTALQIPPRPFNHTK